MIKYRNIVELDFPNFSGCVFAALLADLLKTFDYIPHDLIIAKLAAHGFDTNSLKLLHNYLSNRKQRVKVNGAYSIRKDIFYGVPKDSILEPYFSIYTYVFCFISKKTLTSQVMQMVTLSIQLRKTKANKKKQSLML